MNKEQFAKAVVKNYDVRKIDNTKSYYRNRYIYLDNKDTLPIEHLYLYWEWSTGGVSGGSCWDSSNPQPYTSSEVEDSALDRLFEEYFPNITFLSYRNFLSKFVKVGEYSLGEYYGNCTNYATRTVNLLELYNFLVDKGVFSE